MQFIIGFVVGAVAGWYWRGKKSGVGAINAERQEAREESLAKIMAMFENRQEIANDDVEKLLAVSNSTAFNYLKELESQGKVTQIGSTGQSVTYRKATQ